MAVHHTIFYTVMLQQHVDVVKTGRACIVVPNFTDHPFVD